MSLKALHIVFIVVSTLLAAGFGVWALGFSRSEDGGWIYLALGLIGLAAAVGLPIYGSWFLKKTKHVSYI